MRVMRTGSQIAPTGKSSQIAPTGNSLPRLRRSRDATFFKRKMLALSCIHCSFLSREGGKTRCLAHDPPVHSFHFLGVGVGWGWKRELERETDRQALLGRQFFINSTHAALVTRPERKEQREQLTRRPDRWAFLLVASAAICAP